MLWLSFLLSIAGVYLLVARRQMQHLPSPWVAFAAAGVALLIATFTIVPAGEVGVVVVLGRVREGYLTEGPHLVNPLARVETLSARSQDYTMVARSDEGQRSGDDSIFVQSKDGVRMNMDVTVIYKLAEADAPAIYRRLGRHYVDSVIRPAARAAVPEVGSRFAFQEAYAMRREELGPRIEEHLSGKLRALLARYPEVKGPGVLIQQVLVRKVEPDFEVMKSIQAKMREEQESLRMDFVIAKERKEAERKEIEARGIQKFQDIVTQGISDRLLQWKGIEATERLAQSPNSKVLVIGAGRGGLPIILNP
jgi:regulator of protease activity HflC (stomatin/prohibitin superfamily)